MKAYIIYKFEDKKTVSEMLDNILEQCTFDPLLLPESPLKNWKKYSKKKIKEADCAILFLGQNSYLSGNIDWELSCFIKQDKPIYVVKLNSTYQLNQSFIS